MKYSCLLLSVYIYTWINSVVCDYQEYKLVLVLHRHGQRSPTHIYKNDVNQAEAWPMGLGQLTKKGKLEEYELGRFLRKRYANFLSESFNFNDVYFRSTDVERTLMSAQLVATGLYPTNMNTSWTNKSGLYEWQPIPISTMPVAEDRLLKANKVDCPRAKQELNSEKYKEIMSKYSKKYKELFDELTHYTGQKIDSTTVSRVHDTIFNERLHNISQPAWVKLVWDRLNAARNELATLRVPTSTLKKLYGGAFIGEIISNCEKRLRRESDIQIYDYSAHDKTLSTIMSTLGIHNGLKPTYSSAIMFELIDKVNSRENYLRIVYRNDSTADPFILTPKSCKNSECTFEEFKEATKNIIVRNYKKACETDPSFSVRYHISFVLLACTFALTFSI